jgi:hypothetical protein
MTQETKRESFIFYRSFYEAIQDLPKENQLELYNAIAQYSLNFEEKTLNGISKTIFKLIKPQLDANNKRFINGKKGAEHGKKGAEHGKKGGRPRKQTPLDVEKNPPKNPPNNNNNNNNNNNDNKLIVQNENHFEQFWQHYTPIEQQGRAVSKGNKKEAKAEYQKQLKTYTHNQIMQGLKNYLTFCKEKGQLTLQAVRFLKKQTFLDEFNIMIKPPTPQTEAEKSRAFLDQYKNSIK